MASIGPYHIFAIPMSYEHRGEIEESISFTELENDLTDGYYHQLLLGSENGLRRWKIGMPTLAGLEVISTTVESVNGEQVSREQYLWDLFCHTKVTGQPFAFPSPRTNQYYLARFADRELSYQKLRCKIYSTGVELKQVRVRGVSVYAPEELENVWGYWVGEGPWVFVDWDNLTGGPRFAADGDVLQEVAGGPNDHLITRLNSVSDTGSLFIDAGVMPSNPKDVWFVMKVRETTFADHSGVLTGTIGAPVLVGSPSTTKFANVGFADPDYSYSLNGVQYEQTDQQAPMDKFGVVRVTGSGFSLIANGGVLVGQNQGVSSQEGKIDIAAILLSSQVLPTNISRELLEHFIIKYQIDAS